MKVHGPSHTRAVAAREAPRPTGAKPHAGPARGERVHVSEQARALSEVRGPEVPDSDKIARLREAIRNGSFVIDHQRIADAMIDEEL